MPLSAALFAPLRNPGYQSYSGIPAANAAGPGSIAAWHSDPALARSHGSYYQTTDPSFEYPFANHQTVINQGWNNTDVFSGVLTQDPPFAAEFLPITNNTYSNIASLDSHLSETFGGSLLYESNEDFPPPIAEVAVQVPSVTPDNPTPAATSIATVQVTTDGRFCCSKGCPTRYRNKGDCSRHLKKHNDPLFPCPFHGCDMEFYRHDKLRDHMKQGHGTTVSVPGNRRRQRGVASH